MTRKHSTVRPGKWGLLIALALTVLLLLSAPPTQANSVTDSQGVTWTATREYNSSSGGWDVRVSTDQDPPDTYWITEDSTGDESPFIQINPDTDRPWVIFSHQALNGYRLYEAHFDGSDFTTPAAVTSGGTGFSDEQPHFAFNSSGDIHLVFFRDDSSGTDRAFYTAYTGSWSTIEQYSLDDDAVTGSTFVKILGEDPDGLEASYHYGESYERHRYKDGPASPWTN